MTLKEQLANDYKEAMKTKDDIKKNAVNGIRAAIKRYEIDNKLLVEGKEIDEKQIVAIITKEVKMRKDAIPDFEKAGRKDLTDIYNKENEILSAYLPEPLSNEAIREKIEKIASELNIAKDKSNMGKLMGPAMKELKGLADGDDVRKVIEEFLS